MPVAAAKTLHWTAFPSKSRSATKYPSSPTRKMRDCTLLIMRRDRADWLVVQRLEDWIEERTASEIPVDPPPQRDKPTETGQTG